MAIEVNVTPSLFEWARERSGQSHEYLVTRFPKLPNWESGDLRPTLKKLEEYAQATYTPVGFFFLPQPPDEQLPLPDFRRMRDSESSRPSANLLDTIYLCEKRQDWYRDYARRNGDDPVSFVGSLQATVPVSDAAAQLREHLGFELAQRRDISTWSDALSELIVRIEDSGVLVMVSGVVGSNTRRKLDPQEFRGFALVDEFAPLIFVNGADTKAAQIFTLVHEYAHLWIGQSALSNASPSAFASNRIERWCNEVAAELLVPLDSIRNEYARKSDLTVELERLARMYKVSTLVILRRVLDVGFIDRTEFNTAYDLELARVIEMKGSGSGGNFYNTAPVRASKRFTRAIIGDALEGQTPFLDAFRLLGFRNQATFDELSRTMGVV